MGQGHADDPRDAVCVVAVIYEEPEWEQTKACLQELDVPVFYVDRGGVGSLAEAYNRGFSEHGSGFDYVWFVSNVTFSPSTLPRLVASAAESGCAAVHPAFESDHAFLQPDGTGRLMCVPFVEFTAPLVRSDVFAEIRLDETMPYWGHDLDWGYRARKAGYRLACDMGARIGHTYVRFLTPSPVTVERMKARGRMDRPTQRRLVEKYGHRWRETLCRHASSWTATECSPTAP